MRRIDANNINQKESYTYDVLVVGSGPAGAAAASRVARAGAKCAVLEEGGWLSPADFKPTCFAAMAAYYRDMGSSLMFGKAPMPFVQGRGVGGTSLVNGAISWRLPKDVFDSWIEQDQGLAENWQWSQMQKLTDEVEKRLRIKPTAKKIAGANNNLLAKGAEALGLEHRAISRNVTGCEGLGQCLQGCPKGHKNSVDRNLLADAEKGGAHVFSHTKVLSIRTENHQVTGVEAISPRGIGLRFYAKKVIVAASAVQSPALLLQSGIKHNHTGLHFQCHPGISVLAYYSKPVTMWQGATQGHEVIGMRKEGIKFEALGFDQAILAMRLKGTGSTLTKAIEDMHRVAIWGAAIKAEGRGRVRPGQNRARVTFDLTKNDVVKFRKGVATMARMHLAAGAEHVRLGVYGSMQKITSDDQIKTFEQNGSLNAKHYAAAATHLFGSCRMSSDANKGVVRGDFRHHKIEGLYIADSSVFITNTGVNPQTSIIAMALRCGEIVVA